MPGDKKREWLSSPSSSNAVRKLKIALAKDELPKLQIDALKAAVKKSAGPEATQAERQQLLEQLKTEGNKIFRALRSQEESLAPDDTEKSRLAAELRENKENIKALEQAAPTESSPELAAQTEAQAKDLLGNLALGGHLAKLGESLGEDPNPEMSDFLSQNLDADQAAELIEGLPDDAKEEFRAKLPEENRPPRSPEPEPEPELEPAPTSEETGPTIRSRGPG